MEQNNAIAYKTWIENLREPAPEGAWNAIADQLDIDATWDEIAESLDLDDVWRNIETELPAPVPASGQVHVPKLLWVAAALVLFTLTTPVPDNLPVLQEQTQSSQIRDDNGIIIKPDAQPAGQAESQSEVKMSKEASRQPKAFERFASMLQPENRLLKSSVGASADDPADLIAEPIIVAVDSTATQNEPVILESKIGNIARTIEQPADTVVIVQNKVKPDSLITVAIGAHPKDSAQRKQVDRARWRIGLIGSLKNTWLINPETANGLKRSSLNDTRLTFGKEFGVTLQRSIGGTADIQVEYYFYSQIGQRYHEYINALYQTKDVRLNYQKFQVVYRMRVLQKVNAPALYAVGGIRVSRLTLADTSIGNESQEVTQQYRPWDYGFILGGEAEFKLSTKLLFVSGLRTSYGLRNIYLGTNQAPAEFNKTHTASLGLMVGLKYCIN